MFRDLKPYVCTFKECDLRMFRSRHEWFAHELQVHRREWACEYCHHEPFSTAELFSTHLVSTHPAVLRDLQLKAIVLQSEEPIDKVPVTACKLCDQWETEVRGKNQDPEMSSLDEKRREQYGTLTKFRKHLGRHMEQLALFALPIEKGKEDEDLSSDGAEEEELSDHVEDDSQVEKPGHDAKTEEEHSLSENSRDDGAQLDNSKGNIAKPPTKQQYDQLELSEGKVAEPPATQSHVQLEHLESKTTEFPPTESNFQPHATRESTFFISGDGIDREVLVTDICRYLGNDALVKPGTHHVNPPLRLFPAYSVIITERLYRTDPLDRF